MRILVTALGTLNSTFIANFLKKNNNFVIGTDINDSFFIQASKEVDKFYKVSSILEIEQYEKEIFEICKGEAIEYVIPIIDEEVFHLSKNRDKFLNIGTKICTPDIDCVEICRNKYKTFELIKKEIPEIYVETYRLSDFVNSARYPFFVKPISGRASMGCFKVTNQQCFDYIKSECTNENEYIVQNFLEGKFITVDFINDADTGTFFAIPREELARNKNGCGTVVKIFKDAYIENTVKKIAEIIKYNGVGNVEFILQNNKLNLIEINPRFSAGTEYSVRAGADLITDEINLIDKKNIKPDYKIKYGTVFTRRYETYEFTACEESILN